MSMADPLRRLVGNEIARGVASGETFHYVGLWDGTQSYTLGQAVRLLPIGDDDCGDGVWIARDDIPDASDDAPNPDPCALSASPASPWSAVSEIGPVDVSGNGNPTQLEEGDDDDGPLPLPAGSTWRDVATGDLYTTNGSAWTAAGGGGGPTPIVFANDPVVTLTQGAGNQQVNGQASGTLTAIDEGVWWIDAWTKIQVPDGFAGEEAPIVVDFAPLFNSLDISADEFRASEGMPIGHATGIIGGARVSDMHVRRADDETGRSCGILALADGTVVTTTLVDADTIEVLLSSVIWLD